MQRQMKTGWVVVLVTILAAASVVTAAEQAKVNINTAGVEELMLLPRVGPSVAQRIVEFRDSNGRFKAVEDLMLVRGIGEKTFELIKPHVAVTGDTTLKEKVAVPRAESGES